MVTDLFSAENPQFAKMPWAVLQGKTEQQIAQILAESAIYLSLCRFEASPLSILEALASGCIVAGFTGQGGRIYANSTNGFWVAEDDTLEAVTQLARAVRLVVSGGEPLAQSLTLAINEAYRWNRTQFDDRVVGFWKDFLARRANV